jgi:hypothetical protein
MTVISVTHDFEFPENGTWAFSLRFCAGQHDLTYDPGTGTFVSRKTHKLVAGDRVVLVIKSGDALPEGFDENQPYWVLADGLTTLRYKLSEAQNGDPISPPAAGDAEIISAKCIDISNDVLDADIASLVQTEDDTEQRVGTFDVSKTDPLTGLARFRRAPDATPVIAAGRYQYDVSRTTPDDDRYYYLGGTITVSKTVSRND